VRFVVSMALACAACSAESTKLDAKAQAVIERSQQTSATYSLFAWNDVPDGGEIKDGWSAEFHSGNLHRVEAPHVRIVADCKEMVGTRLLVATGEKLTDPSVAKAACGINANFEIQSAEWLGHHKTEFGMADRVRITDEDTIRTYEVLDNGALATSVYQRRDGQPLVNNWSVVVRDSVPDDIFSEASLEQSAVPAEFQSAPASLRD
jgi:hypothetical protein